MHVTFNNLGGPVLYKVALLSAHRRLAVSKALTVYWTPAPGGVFAELAGDYASYTSRTNPSESEANVTFPMVTATTVIPLTATMSGPHGQTIVATRLITVYP